ncbi:MAG: pentapeptide repeat-containing protein [Verrucomicrobiales bacterium]|nr:pentapeptide repeat-containing protein [Verrucomicrobiales bacterium]
MKNISVIYEFTANHDFGDQDLSGWNFKRVVFPGCKFNRCKMVDCALDEAVFIHCTGVGAELESLDYCTLRKCLFSSVKVTAGLLSLKGAEVEQGGFRSTRILKFVALGAKFSGTEFIDCQFDRIVAGSSLAHTVLKRCNFYSCSFDRIDLRNTRFEEGTLLDHCDLTGAQVGEATDLKGAILNSCKIDRRTLEMLGPEGVTPAQERVFQIDDPVMKMSFEFSGVKQYLHVGALIVFLAPYLLFIVENYIRGRLMEDPGQGMPLFEKLVQFALTGGTFTALRWDHVAVLAFLVIYNGIRGVLLWKTKKLELEVATTKRAPQFCIRGGWKALFIAFEWALGVNLALVAYHTYRFMQMTVPRP